jgi:vacuolar-type H+-ATPase subunit E/Vma4
MSNEKIVTAIIADANAYADSVKVKANTEAEKIILTATTQAEEYLSAKKVEAENDALQIINNKRTLIRLDKNKVGLSARRKALDGVYSTAIKMLENADAKTYLAVIEKMLEKYYEKGEEITLSSTAPVTENEVSSLKVFNGEKITVTKNGNFSGGVQLSGNGYVKTLTFSALIEGLRADTETEIFEKLF